LIGQSYQINVQTDIVFGRATAPFCLLVSDRSPGVLEIMNLRQFLQSADECINSLRLVDFGLPGIRWCILKLAEPVLVLYDPWDFGAQKWYCSIDGFTPGYGQSDGLIGPYRNPEVFRSFRFYDCHRADGGNFNNGRTHIDPEKRAFLQT
jgi:hypothetical protein